MIQTIAFYLFAIMVVLSAGLVITARNPVHSVLWLILAFFNAAGLMLLVGAEFIAMLLVIVYVGAVAVLFLFVVMMLDIDFSRAARRLHPLSAVRRRRRADAALRDRHRGRGVAGRAGRARRPHRARAGSGGDPQHPGARHLLYTRYLFVFEGAGLVLLVAMIGAIVLTHRARGGVRQQNVRRQNMRRPQDATRNTNPPVGQGVEL